ncbi:type II secretion system F family protein [Candidatus Atribacteria bacterium MT.SAG.1]|nr:type II secretion system F family protein [Candidatus Atribacteria bacterium MT.SAG.1]
MKFSYKARTKEGKVQKGMIEAFSKKGALSVLEKYGFYVTFLEETKKLGFFQRNIFPQKVSFKDITVFTRQISVMLKSAISPVEALRSQVSQAENQGFREKILKISEMVETGTPLSQAFSIYPDIFDSFYVNCVKSGEASGKVADSLNYLAEHLESEYNLRSKIKGAMIYPIVVITASIAVFGLVMFFIVPRMTSVLQNMSGDLPTSTKVVISLSNFIRGGGWVLIMAFFGSLFFIPQYLKRSEKGRKFYDRISLQIPILGDFYKKVYLSRFSENLSILIAAGLPITQALKITRKIIGNSVYEEIIKNIEERVARGETISSVLVRYPKEIPSFLIQMVSTGEKTGRLEDTLKNVVDFYKGDIERFVDNLAKIIEPIMIIILGIMVGILVISIFVPLFQLSSGGMGGF